MVGGCTIIGIWCGGISFGFTAFVKPIADDLGWSYLAISFAISLRNAELGLIAPIAGILSDRIGSGKVAFYSTLISGIGLLLLSQTTTLVLFYTAFILFSIGMAGMGHVVVTTAIAHWFRKRLGQATGIVIAGYGIGGIIVPLISLARSKL